MEEMTLEKASTVSLTYGLAQICVSFRMKLHLMSAQTLAWPMEPTHSTPRSSGHGRH